ncbi:MAG TPA: efflux RND transporter periplasmic adaptor subunit [Anaeromyxobacteraceae bacterium]|nr:efflux RND transporter periplasmic adaptor subunit [Anaeromyxobacteraceae bacterium]
MRHSIRPALAAAAVLSLAACSSKDKAPPALPPPEVPVVKVQAKDTPLDFELVAQIRGMEDVEIRARVEGYLETIDYPEGSSVKKGQLLFTIDDQQYVAALAQAQATLANAETSFAKADLDVRRFTPLAAERAVSQAELDNAVSARKSGVAAVEAAKANLERARLNLSYTRISSPIHGIAGKAEHKVGDLVGKGDPTLLTTVSSIDPIRDSVNLPEADYLRFSKAVASGKSGPAKSAPVLILSDGSQHPYPGKVLFVDRAVDPTTGTLRVDLSFPNPEKTLRPGLYGKVKAEAEVAKGALLVPQRAVQELQGTYTVVVVGADGKVETRKVKPGAKVGSSWIMDDGLKDGDQVVVEGFQRLRDGMTVVPKPAQAAATPPAAPAAPAGGK